MLIHKIVLILGLATFTFTAGCALNNVQKKQTVLTGLFDNDLKKLESAYDAVKPDMTKSEVVALGLKPKGPKIKNVKVLEGAEGAKFFLGTEQARPVIDDPLKYKDHVLELQKYETWVFPHVNLKTQETSDLFDSNRTSVKKGPEHYFIIVFYNDLVLTKKKVETIKEERDEEEKSVWGGIISTLFNIGARVGRKF